MTHYKHILLVESGADIWLGTDTRNISSQTYYSAIRALEENGVLVLKYNHKKPELLSLEQGYEQGYEQGLPACGFVCEDYAGDENDY